MNEPKVLNEIITEGAKYGAEQKQLGASGGVEGTDNNLLTVYDPKFAAQQMLKNGKVEVSDLKKMIPDGTSNGFKPSTTITDGYKYNYSVNGTKVEIKWHSPDANAASKYPESNSGSGWTAQIKVGNKLLGQDGKFYKKPSNITHIPVQGVR